MRATLLGFVLLLGACGPQLTTEEDVRDSDGADLSTAELKAATTGMTVWLKPTFVKQTRDGRDVWVLKGRASVNLEGAMSFVPDDRFCETTTLTARTFEVVCDPRGEMNSLLSGLPLFISLRQPDGRSAVARFAVSPSFQNMTGTTKVWLTNEIKPIYVAEVGLSYRGKVRVTGALGATVGGAPVTLLPRGTPNELNVDLSFDQLMAGALGATGAVFTHDLEGASFVKKASIAFGVSGLELQRTDDAYQTWPSPTCTSAVQQCLYAAGAAAYDFEACGGYRQVQRCNIPSNLPKLGWSPDDRQLLTAALATVNASLPANKQITSFGFYVEMLGSSGKPQLAQVVAAWQKMDASPTTSEGDRTAGQVNTDLDAFGARSLVPAIQKVVYQQAFKAHRLSTESAHYEILYFSGAARVEVIRLPK